MTRYHSASHKCDAHKQEWIHVTRRVGEEPVLVKVVRTGSFRNRQGQTINELASIRRALAHHRAGYVGPLQCKLHEGEGADCKFCWEGIPKFVCGDCNEPLPACRCLRTDSFLTGAGHAHAG